MENALSAFLKTPTTSRRAGDYEAVYDDFVAFAGGGRVADRFTVPANTLNADYHLVSDDWELVLELKQLAAYRSEDTIDAYFSRRIDEGKLRWSEPLGPNQIRIGPESFSASDWRRFYKTFRPSVTTHLDKAAKQLKATGGFLPPATPDRPRIFGVVLLNSGDFNLSTDLLHRLVEFRTKDKWRRGLYSRVDFVSCVSLDLVQADRHALHSRHIAKEIERPAAVSAARYLHDRWIHYGAAAVGATVTFDPEGAADEALRLETKVVGKLRWTPPTAAV